MSEMPCATDPELFFSTHAGSAKQAKALCVGCDVRLACLTLALDEHEAHGIWGGLDEIERARISTSTPSTNVCALDGCHTYLPIAANANISRRKYCSLTHAQRASSRAWNARNNATTRTDQETAS